MLHVNANATQVGIGGEIAVIRDTRDRITALLNNHVYSIWDWHPRLFALQFR